MAETLRAALRGKRVGVVLSAGYFGFFGHAGFLAALDAAGIVPSAWAGTSAGALVAAMAAAGLDAAAIGRLLVEVKKEQFWDPAPIASLLDAARGRGITGLLAGARFRKLLEDKLPVRTFEELRTPLVIVTADVSAASPRVHVEGPLSVAVHASCAYPGLFRTVPVDGAQLWDGGLVDKAPLVALAERVPLDALLVHYLPSESRAAPPPKRPHGYLSAMAQALGAVRHEHYLLQARLLEARGTPVYELSPELPKVEPKRLAAGKDALARAAAHAAAALAGPAAAARPHRSGA